MQIYMTCCDKAASGGGAPSRALPTPDAAFIPQIKDDDL